MRALVERVYNEYAAKREEISRGFIKAEHVEFLETALQLKERSNTELRLLRKVAYKFFDELYCEFNQEGELIGYKPYSEDVRFAMDSQSAWMAVFDRAMN